MVTPEELRGSRCSRGSRRSTSSGSAVSRPTSARPRRVRRARGRRAGALRRPRRPDRGGENRRTAIERVREREPGEIFGEVPITLGTVFPVGFRAAASLAGVRLEPHDYHALAAVRRRRERGRRARAAPDRRAARLQGLAADADADGRSWSATAGTPRAPSCGTSSTATRSRSGGSSRTCPTRPRSVGPLPAEGDCPAIGSWTARPWSGRSCAGWRSCSASHRAGSTPSTTR